MDVQVDIDTRSPWVGRAGRNAFLLASALSGIVVTFHIVATPQIMDPVYSANLPPALTGVLDVLWYQMAAVVACAAFASLAAAFRNAWRWPVAWIVGGHFLMVAAICLFFSFAWFGHPWGLLQWTFFGPVGLITFWAASRSPEG
jgi:hypothetical protein